ncbi:hypothetical protein F5B18DRAFT_115094 [Nemania serpens]|nr:hypothetical protein F5B18DRAFT_115094 [Nemania serpens]
MPFLKAKPLGMVGNKITRLSPSDKAKPLGMVGNRITRLPPSDKAEPLGMVGNKFTRLPPSDKAEPLGMVGNRITRLPPPDTAKPLGMVGNRITHLPPPDRALRRAVAEQSRRVERKTRREIEEQEKHMKHMFLPEPIGPKRMTLIIAPKLNPGVVMYKRLLKKLHSGKIRGGTWTETLKKVDSTMSWTEIPDKYTRQVVLLRLQCLDLLATQRLYWALQHSNLEDRAQMAKEIVTIAEKRLNESLNMEDARLRMLRVVPVKLLRDKATIPTKYSQMFSFLEKFLKMQFPNAEAASPFTRAFRLFWAAELLSVELSLREVSNAGQQLVPNLSRMSTSHRNRLATAGGYQQAVERVTDPVLDIMPVKHTYPGYTYHAETLAALAAAKNVSNLPVRPRRKPPIYIRVSGEP